MAQVLVGIDGGWSKTAGVVVEPDGRVLARARMAGSAVIGKPKAESCQVLRGMVDRLCAEAAVGRDSVVRCGLGLNGVDFSDEFAMQHAVIGEAMGLPGERLSLVNDGIAALWGATPASAAVMVQLGSGNTTAYRSRHGGETLFDHLNVTQLFDMRSGLIVMVARMIKGQTAATPLKEKALAFYGVREEEYAEAVYRDHIPRERRMYTPPLIFRSWLEGDPAAEQLVGEAVGDYALAAKAMIARTGSPCPDVAFGGGVLASAPPQFWQLLTERIRVYYPQVAPRPPQLPPEGGAAIMAGFEIGLDPQVLFRRVRENWPRQREPGGAR